MPDRFDQFYSSTVGSTWGTMLLGSTGYDMILMECTGNILPGETATTVDLQILDASNSNATVSKATEIQVDLGDPKALLASTTILKGGDALQVRAGSAGDIQVSGYFERVPTEEV